MVDAWQAGRARHHFSEIVDSAVEGKPQFIRRRDGREVVLVSREYFERTKPSLKSYLLSSGYATDEDDAFDRAMRGATGPLLRPRKVDLKPRRCSSSTPTS